MIWIDYGGKMLLMPQKSARVGFTYTLTPTFPSFELLQAF
jgi:hypothetical protein